MLQGAVTKTSLTLRYPLSEAYLLFVYVPLLFVLCLLLQSHSSPPFTAAFRALAHSFLPLCVPSFSMCAASRGGIDGCLSAQATLKAVDGPVALAALSWQRVVSFAEVAERH